MLRRKGRAVVFGAGVAGQRALKCLRHRYRIVAFADNDPRKQGQRVLRRPVVSAQALTSMDCDKVFIASLYSQQIYEQLLNEVGIDPDRMETVRQDILSGEYEVSGWTIAVLVFLSVLAIGLVLGSSLLAWQWFTGAR